MVAAPSAPAPCPDGVEPQLSIRVEASASRLATRPATRPVPACAVVGDWDLVVGEAGPGTRFVLFVQGCPLRCLYCASPGSWDDQVGHLVEVDQVLAHVRRYRPLFDLTGGGLTISGGEPLLYPEFVEGVVRGCRVEGVHVALDTTGVLGDRLDDAVLARLDLALLDIKSFDPVVHRHVTGGEVAPSLRFARRLAALGRPIRLRFVVVPGLTDAAANVAALADFAAGLGTVERVEVVPFHRGGQAGWEAAGLRFPLAGRPGPTREALAAVRAVFADAGLALA